MRYLLLGCIILVGTTGCTKTIYNWHSYESSLYQYYKNPDSIHDYAESLSELVKNDNHIPPGLYAEYGYILYIMGKSNEALSYFQKEKETWPESTYLMDLMTKKIKAIPTSKAVSNQSTTGKQG